MDGPCCPGGQSRVVGGAGPTPTHGEEPRAKEHRAVSWGCCNQSAQAGRLQTTGVMPSQGEVRQLTPRCWSEPVLSPGDVVSRSLTSSHPQRPSSCSDPRTVSGARTGTLIFEATDPLADVGGEEQLQRSWEGSLAVGGFLFRAERRLKPGVTSSASCARELCADGKGAGERGDWLRGGAADTGLRETPRFALRPPT